MIVDNILLPRFLIIELLLACHYFHFAKTCASSGSRQGRAENMGGDLLCQIDFERVGWKNQPLFLSSDREWLRPGESRMLRIKDGAEIKFSCPGSAVNSSGGAPSLLLSCSGGRLKDQGKDVDLLNYGCDKNPRDEERRTGQRCGPNLDGELVEIGFNLESSFAPVYTLCHNGLTENTYYAQHTVNGPTVQYNNNEEGRPAFKEGKFFFKTVSASNLYERTNQNQVLSRILGDAKRTEIIKENYFARGHLAPDADFLYRDWQEATYYYGNVVPQWQSINNGNWKRVEGLVREKARKAGRNLEVRTGSLGTLKLTGSTGPEEVWLGKQQNKNIIPAPEYVFKIITDMDARESIAVFITNNPFVSKLTRSSVLCTDICDQTGWGAKFSNRTQVEKGWVFCCSPEQAGSLVPWAGADYSSFSTLRFN